MTSVGVTLPELILCLLIIGVAAHAVARPARHQADLMTVRSAREEVIALVQRARAEARSSGEASVVIEEGVDPYMLRGSAAAPGGAALSSRGVKIEVLGPRSSVTLKFGPMGVARFAAASLRLSKRNAEARLVVSSYGRIRR